MIKKIFTLTALVLFGLVNLGGCDQNKDVSKPQANVEQPSNDTKGFYQPSSTVSNETESEIVRKKAEEKGLTETMVHSLENLGFLEQEILNLSSERIAEIFAPGALNDGAPAFMANDKQIDELNKVSIDSEMSAILGNLGYKYDEMLRLAPNEVDFIFPNTELMANLAQKGFSEQEIKIWLDKGKTYKEVIREALRQ